MENKYLQNIELNKVVELATRHTSLPQTHTLLQQELPARRVEDVRMLLQQTHALAAHMLKNGHPRLSSCPDAERAVSRAEKGGMLSMAELLNISIALRNFSSLANWFEGEKGEEKPGVVADLFYAIRPQPALEHAIREAILSDTEMADTASDELYTLRRKIRAAEGAIRDKLDAVIKNPNTAKYLQDALVSIRNGRFVVPVRAEHRSDIPGIIHDVSQSGGTLFIEPAAVVEQNAKIMQLRNAEQAEIERILGEFSQQVADIAYTFTPSWGAMLEIDKRLAKAELGLEMDAVMPEVREDLAFSLVKARHPLLDKHTAVPVDIALGDGFDTLVITGPNTGGKTVSLKTAGLLSAMAQMGYLIPAHDSSSVCVFEHILVDIGDEQSIEQSLSTFSGHIRNIEGILRQVNERSLVLLDELGAGTDPAEGAALAIAIIERLRKSGALVMATTHYAELKMFALETEGVQNAGSEFDIETLRPTYRLILGVPGRSNAFLISEKLGIPQIIIDNAKKHLSTEQRRFETVLAQLEDMKLAMHEQEEEIDRLRHAASHQLEEAEKKKEALIHQGEIELEAARRQAKALADEVQRAADELMDEMKRLEKDRRKSESQKLQRARQIANKEAGKLNSFTAGKGNEKPLVLIPLEQVEIGQEVWLPQMEKTATVSALPDKNHMVEVRMGALKTKIALKELSAMPSRSKKQPQKQRVGSTQVRRSGGEASAPRTPMTELYLLGKTVDEALMETDQFIDNAVMRGLATLYIIHGRGTGALRSAISQHLKTNRHVKSYRLGRYGEGEDGVTVVEVK